MAKVSPLANETANRAWRMHAIQLAFERKLAGQAMSLESEEYSTRRDGWYTCVSATEPVDHMILYDRKTGGIRCDCKAGEQLAPCSHAGAVLLLVTGCAPERVRNALGFTNE